MSIEAQGSDLARGSALPKRGRSIVCPRCGELNARETLRCRSCLTALTAARAPRTAKPILSQSWMLDSMLGELESLTRDEVPEELFQCPRCGGIVEEDATRCSCGVAFEEPSDDVEYSCARCSARVSASATRCACGAVFLR